jgi:hypothetical protein
LQIKLKLAKAGSALTRIKQYPTIARTATGGYWPNFARCPFVVLDVLFFEVLACPGFHCCRVQTRDSVLGVRAGID